MLSKELNDLLMSRHEPGGARPAEATVDESLPWQEQMKHLMLAEW